MNTESKLFLYFIFFIFKIFAQIETAAALAKRLPQEHCDFYSKKFKKLFTEFNISTTQFIRTTEPRHKRAVQHFWVIFGFVLCVCNINFFFCRIRCQKMDVLKKKFILDGIQQLMNLFISLMIQKKLLLMENTKKYILIFVSLILLS